MREDWPTILFYEGPSPKWALLEWLRPQPNHLIGRQVAGAEVGEVGPGWSVIDRYLNGQRWQSREGMDGRRAGQPR